MNYNGMCAMEIDNPAAVCGRDWHAMWPEVSRGQIADSIALARQGTTARFDAFCPTAKGSPRWWNVSVSAVRNPDGSELAYLAISRDVTVAETQRQALVIAAHEMRHRLKNTYAMIGSLFRGFAKGDAATERFAKDMQARLIALSSAQCLFAEDHAPGDVAVLVPALIAPFSSPNCPVSTAQVASITVSRGQADAIALVLGELAVNSAKHGALCGGGSIAVESDLTETGYALVWNERSAIPVTAHRRTGGQGLDLIERIVKARDGTITFDWAADGLTVTLRFDRPAV
jgi:two-component sensor histidine kinase